jgi:hypothetical protein
MYSKVNRVNIPKGYGTYIFITWWRPHSGLQSPEHGLDKVRYRYRAFLPPNNRVTRIGLGKGQNSALGTIRDLLLALNVGQPLALNRSTATLIKKKIRFFSYVRKFRMEQLQSQLYDEGLLPKI